MSSLKRKNAETLATLDLRSQKSQKGGDRVGEDDEPSRVDEPCPFLEEPMSILGIKNVETQTTLDHQSSPPEKSQQKGDDGSDEDEPSRFKKPSAVLHEVSYPETCVKDFPFEFELDPFQSEAIKCIDIGESVMVSAHASVEKTNVALYAIARSLINQKRVIYTNPIKALCKQKYRELKKKFSDVGLMTGDLTIDPNASCLVMSTEIWHSILYKGSEVMQEVAWIIFEEVSYMCDKERGVSWEEIIIMAPKSSRFVFLSAIVPNAKEFADWVAEVRRQPCHIVYTDHRPIPLQHYIFPFRGDNLYLILDERGKFLEHSFQKALNSLTSAGEGNKKREKREESKGFLLVRHKENNIFKMVKLIIQRQYIPAIILSFSKRDCEFLAKQMAGMDLNDADEKANVETIIWQTMDKLSDDDKKLPQVAYMLSLLKRGFGVHHSDMLPILKEVTEILFQGGLIKCLFATETSSRGLNMPAKTVVFTNVRKFDGDKIRWISNGEYFQMSGCAGRRGIDQQGICILMIDEKMEPSTAKMMMKGSADCLNSGFHVSYNMLLNQMRCEDGDPENILRKSFYQFRGYRALTDLEKQAKHLEAERDSIIIEGEEKLKDVYDRLQLYNSLKKDVRDNVYSPEYCLPFLLPGTLVCVQCTRDDHKPSFSIEDNVTWGVLVDFFERPKDQGEDKQSEDSDYTVNVLTRCMINNKMGAGKSMKIVPVNEHGEAVVVSLPLSKVIGLSFLMLSLPDDLSPLKARENTLDELSSVVSSFNEHGLPLLDPEEDLKVQSSLYEESVKSIKMLESSFEKDGIKNSPLIQQKLKVFHDKQVLTARINSIKKAVGSSMGLAFKDELEAHKRVLRRLGYTTSDDVVQLKGRMACEISSADELTLTELIFNGAFKDVNVEEMVALLSCFVWQEKLPDAQKPREELDLLFIQLRETARTVATVQLECEIQIDVENFVSSFCPDIMAAVYAWAKGSTFMEIMEIAQVFDGSLIRAIRGVEEILQQLSLAAKAIGETQLGAKFEDAVTKIKRGIVFAGSL